MNNFVMHHILQGIVKIVFLNLNLGKKNIFQYTFILYTSIYIIIIIKVNLLFIYDHKFLSKKEEKKKKKKAR